MNNSEPRAKSRITKPAEAEVEKPDARLHRKIRLKSTSSFSLPSLSLPMIKADSALASKYLHATPFLIVSLLLYAILFYIFTMVSPQHIAHWLLYQSYVPIIILFFFATTFLFRFLFLRQRLGWALGLWLTVLLFLKLQEFVLTVPVVLITAISLIVPVLIWPVLFKK